MYEEYMQNLLGIQTNPYKTNYRQMQYNYLPNNPYVLADSTSKIEQLENMYPEIYKILYPMIKKASSQNTSQMTPETLETMTQEIYSNIEAGNIINISVDVSNNSESDNSNTNITQYINNYLYDLIKILLLREVS